MGTSLVMGTELVQGLCERVNDAYRSYENVRVEAANEMAEDIAAREGGYTLSREEYIVAMHGIYPQTTRFEFMRAHLEGLERQFRQDNWGQVFTLNRVTLDGGNHIGLFMPDRKSVGRMDNEQVRPFEYRIHKGRLTGEQPFYRGDIVVPQILAIGGLIKDITVDSPIERRDLKLYDLVRHNYGIASVVTDGINATSARIPKLYWEGDIPTDRIGFEQRVKLMNKVLAVKQRFLAEPSYDDTDPEQD